MFPIGPEANTFDKECRAIARPLNNKLGRSCRNRKEVITNFIQNMREEKGDYVVQYLLQYVGFDNVYDISDDLISLEAKASSFQRSLGRFTRSNTVFQLPRIQLFYGSRQLWEQRDLYDFELTHFHVPPKPEMLVLLREAFCYTMLVDLIREYFPSSGIMKDIIGNKFDHKSFYIDEYDENVYTSYGGKRFLETGYIFVTPDIWYDGIVMKDLLDLGVGVLMYEPCKHKPRCDSYSGSYYKDVFYFLEDVPTTKCDS